MTSRNTIYNTTKLITNPINLFAAMTGLLLRLNPGYTVFRHIDNAIKINNNSMIPIYPQYYH